MRDQTHARELTMEAIVPRSLLLPLTMAIIAMATLMTPKALGQEGPEVVEIRLDPVPFVPFELVDPHTGEPVTPQTVLQIEIGGEVRDIIAKEYFEQLNEIERYLNERGHSLRQESLGDIQKFLTDEAKLDGQAARIDEAIRDFDADIMEKVRTAEELRARIERLREQAAKPSLGDLIDLADESSLPELDLPDVPQVPLITEKPRVKVRNYEADKERTWSFEQGRKSRFAVWGSATMAMKLASGEEKSAYADATAELWGAVVNQEAQILYGDLTYAAPSADSSAWDLEVYIGGFELYDNGGELPTLSVSDTFQHQVDVSQDYRFMIGIIPAVLRVGFAGYGVFGYSAGAVPVRLDGQTWVDVGTRAYAQLGVDFLVAGAGVEANLVILEDRLTIEGSAGLSVKDDVPTLEIDITADNTINAMRGSLDAYAYVMMFGCDGFFCGLKEKRLNHNFFNWKGLSDTGNIFSYHLEVGPGGHMVRGKDLTAQDFAEFKDIAAQLKEDLTLFQRETAIVELENRTSLKEQEFFQALRNDLTGSASGQVDALLPALDQQSEALADEIDTYWEMLEQWLS